MQLRVLKLPHPGLKDLTYFAERIREDSTSSILHPAHPRNFFLRTERKKRLNSF